MRLVELMKKSKNVTAAIFAVGAALCLSSCGTNGQQETAEDVSVEETAEVAANETENDIYEFNPGEDYNLIWADEFDGDSLDKTKWSYQLGNGSDYGIAGWGNGESQIYSSSPENVSVSD